MSDLQAVMPPVVDEDGSIKIHARAGCVIEVALDGETDISTRELFFEIEGRVRKPLAPGDNADLRDIVLTAAEVAALPLRQPMQFALRDESDDLDVPVTLWSGLVRTYGFAQVPGDTGEGDEDGDATPSSARVLIKSDGGPPRIILVPTGQRGRSAKQVAIDGGADGLSPSATDGEFATWLRKPAADAAELVNDVIALAEQKAATADEAAARANATADELEGAGDAATSAAATANGAAAAASVQAGAAQRAAAAAFAAIALIVGGGDGGGGFSVDVLSWPGEPYALAQTQDGTRLATVAYDYSLDLPTLVLPDTGSGAAAAPTSGLLAQDVLSWPGEPKVLVQTEAGVAIAAVDGDDDLTLPTYDPPASEGGAADLPDAVVYIQDCGLWAVGGPGGDRLIFKPDGATVLSVESVPGAWRCAYRYPSGLTRGVRISEAGVVYWDGAVNLLLDLGQSNANGQGGGNPLANIENIAPTRIEMVRTAWGDVRAGLSPNSGANEDPILDPDTITGFMPLASKIGQTHGAIHGTCNIEGMAHGLASLAAGQFGGWVPRLLALSMGEGGETIERLLEGGGSHSYDNVMAAVEKIVALNTARNLQTIADAAIIYQGESDAGSGGAQGLLGAKHELYRQQIEAGIRARTGQVEPLRFFAIQPSSAIAGTAHLRSMLDQHVLSLESGGLYAIVNPGYCYTYGTDFLHHDGPGHDHPGEMAAIALNERRCGRAWDCLRALGTATKLDNYHAKLSYGDDVAFDDMIAALTADFGFAVSYQGTQVASTVDFEVSGKDVFLTTAESMSGADRIRIGHTNQTNPRTLAGIPRINLRSARKWGESLYDGFPLHKHAVHQQIFFA